MKPLSTTFRALRMLGAFGIILVVAIVLVGVAIGSVLDVSLYLDDVQASIEQRWNYQLAEYYLLEMQSSARWAMVVDASELDGVRADYDEYAAGLDGILADVASWEGIYPTTAEDAAVIEAVRDQVDANFEQAAAWTANPAGDPVALLDQFTATEQASNDSVRALVTSADARIDETTRSLEAAQDNAIWMVVGVLVIFPLLTIWAFLSAVGFTQPLLQIDNAIMAVGGETYRPALLAEGLKARGGLGQLARAVQAMADGLQARDAALAGEVAALRQRLNDERQRRLAASIAIPTSEQN